MSSVDDIYVDSSCDKMLKMNTKAGPDWRRDGIYGQFPFQQEAIVWFFMISYPKQRQLMNKYLLFFLFFSV